jgi:para-nitrobenzyl esterase
LTVCLAATVIAPAQAAEPIVKTAYGPVRGQAADGVVAFKGVPFAAPPIGSLRWRAPQPPKRWTTVRDARAYGPDCMQLPFPGDAAPLGVAPAEDCLYLNVWTPRVALGAAKPRPVMVWIYGGGFVNGGTSPSIYNGQAFARDGVVLVSFNYRLGRFGFFAHPALTAADADHGRLGNYALLDQIEALKWVRANIAAFGGDPGNVTVFGESAGGVSLNALLTSPLAKDLFDRAIIQSGGGRPGLLLSLPLKAAAGAPSAEAAGLAFASKQGVLGQDAGSLARLRALPASAIVDGLNMGSLFGATTYSGGPIIDGAILPSDPLTAYQSGAWNKMPVMIGANGADGFFLGGGPDQIYAPFGDKRASAQALYDPDGKTPVDVYGLKAAGDRMFIEPARKVARTLSDQGARVYAYRFSYVASSQRGAWFGAPHATEIPFVFDTVAARYGAAATADDRAAAKAAHAYWIAFASTGQPKVEGLSEWPAYKTAQDQIVDFTNAGPVAEADPLKARLDLTEATVAGR